MDRINYRELHDGGDCVPRVERIAGDAVYHEYVIVQSCHLL